MSKEIECNNIVPGCEFKAHAETEAELLKQVGDHARDAHGLTDVTPELLAKVKAAVVSR